MVTIPVAFDRLYSRGAGIDPAREKSLRISESSSPEELTLLRGLERLYGGIERFREFVVENGKRTVYDGVEADAWRAAHPLPAPPMPPVPPSPATKPVMVIRTGDVPQVVERSCAPGEGGTDSRMILMMPRDGDKRVMTVCTNRVDEMARRVAERATADAERIAGDTKHIERDAKRTAIASLYQARGGLFANRALSAEQRRLAVSGIDEAITELRAEVAARD